RLLDALTVGRERAWARELVGVRGGHRMVRPLVVPVLRGGVDRVPERLIIALEAEERPAEGAPVSAVLGKREAALERVLDQHVDEAHPAARVGLDNGAVEGREDRILLIARQPGVRSPRHGARRAVDGPEPLAVHLAEARQRAARGGVAVGVPNAVAEGCERAELVRGEEATTGGGVDLPEPREGGGQCGQDGAESLQELAPPEEKRRNFSRDGGRRLGGHVGWQPREPEPLHEARLFPTARGAVKRPARP